MEPFFTNETELINDVFTIQFFKILSASFLFLGLDIIAFSKSITLSAPMNYIFSFLLTFVAFISARFLLY